MKRTKVMVWVTAVLLLCISAWSVFAAKAYADGRRDKDSKSRWENSDLGTSRFGTLLYGPEFNKDQLKGKIVLVVFFGTRSGDANALKDIAKLVAKYKKGGFIAIGVRFYAKRGTGKDIVSIAKGLKIKTIPIVDQAQVRFEGKKRDGVKNTSGTVYCPYAVLHGRNGNVIWERRYQNAKKEVTRLIRKELKKKNSTEEENPDEFEEILQGQSFPNSKMVVRQIKAGKLGVAYRRCEKYSDSEGDLGAESSELKKLMEAYHQQKLELFEEQKTTSPVEAMATLKGISKAFAGTEFAREAKKTLAKLKRNKEFKALLKSFKQYERIMAMIKKIPEPPADDSAYKKWVRKYKGKITGLNRKIDAFEKKHPDNPFTSKLRDAMVPLDTGI
ncbi:MAG: hypothetical protein KAR11_01865 [Phycisphaerae bacterium]|nr:hypothetical protein [Phycisphaerae bacterium]